MRVTAASQSQASLFTIGGGELAGLRRRKRSEGLGENGRVSDGSHNTYWKLYVCKLYE